MRLPTITSLALLSAVATSAACGAPSDPAPDAGATPDGGSSDAGALPPCDVAAPIVAGTAETDAIADAPPRCGAGGGAWLRSERLGEVVLRERGSDYTVGLLRGLASGAGVTLPRDPEHRVRSEVIAYVTQDRGALVQSSAVVAWPVDLAAREALPIVLVLHGTSGFAAGCGPSADPSAQALAALFASYGWIAVAPDYLGMESAGEAYGAVHPYLVGEATAIAALDAARAAARVVSGERGTTCGSSRLAVFGGSQGGHATLWVDRLAPYYARELELIGAVATVPASDIVAHADRALTSVVPATANFLAMLATEAAWYRAEDRLDEILVPPLDVDLPAALAASCDPGSALDLPASLDEVFQPSFLDAVSASGAGAVEPVGCWLRESSLLETSVPRITPASASYGILFVVGETDTLIEPSIERAAYDALCAGGLPLEYLECAGAAHVPATLWAIPELLDFLDARRAGEPFTAECARAPATRCAGTPAGS